MVNIEKQIAATIASAQGWQVTKLGLRFDKVVVRLLGDIRSFVVQELALQGTWVLTLTAPIKLPAKTQLEIKAQIRAFVAAGMTPHDLVFTIHQNRLHCRFIPTESKQVPPLIGWVHNPDTDAQWLLDLALQWVKNQ